MDPAIPDQLDPVLASSLEQDIDSFHSLLDSSPPQPSRSSLPSNGYSGHCSEEDCTLTSGELQFSTLFPSLMHVNSTTLPLADMLKATLQASTAHMGGGNTW